MGSSTVKVTGLTSIQANILALAFESGDMLRFLNTQVDENTHVKGIEENRFKSYPDVEFDDDNYRSHHEVTFN
jgi:hypothetical protein